MAKLESNTASIRPNSRTGSDSGAGTPRSGSAIVLGSSPGSNSATIRAQRSRHSSHAGQARPSFSGSLGSGSLDMENPDPAVVRVVGRHLNKDQEDSIRQPGGDITREIYNWQREHETNEADIKRGRSKSIDVADHQVPQIARQMLAPGGFRREFVHHRDSMTSSHVSDENRSGSHSYGLNSSPYTPDLIESATLTRNFIEFLSLYGHFAGEELEDYDDDDEGLLDEEEAIAAGDAHPNEREPLLQHPRRPGLHPRSSSFHNKGTASVTETVMLLLKSFVGTGVLFLPRAFYNGGMLFSSVVLIFVSIVSYWCFLLLIDAKRVAQVNSFGDIGGALYGPKFRQLILFSIVVSQIGFASAYIVFVGENLQSFLYNIANSEQVWTISGLIIVQLLVFMPLSMIRDIAKLGFTALVADAFILAGLLYLYGWGSFELLTEGVQDIALFNSQSWTLFIGTAVFTYEGIGLIIPIQESMREPRKFSVVLGGVMVGITVVFVSAGALLYAATGSKVQTVILLNLPRSMAVNIIQLLYSLAILLSTPLQLFPAIRILEQGLFIRSGKFNRKVKWQKNMFRFGLVITTGLVAYAGSDDLDKFVALIGSAACVPLVYVYPPILHLRVVSPGTLAYMADWLLLVFGMGIMMYTSWTTLQAWVG